MTAMVMKPPTWRLDWPNNVVSGGVSTAMTCSHPECVAGEARAGKVSSKKPFTRQQAYLGSTSTHIAKQAYTPRQAKPLPPHPSLPAHPAGHRQAQQGGQDGAHDGVATQEGPLRVPLDALGLELVHAVGKGARQGEGLVAGEQHPTGWEREGEGEQGQRDEEALSVRQHARQRLPRRHR
jgi:hypothetical protein